LIPEPPFTEASERFRARAREFVLGELRPHADEWEEAGWFRGAPNVEGLSPNVVPQC
jgi:hypothetical protein